MIRIRQCKHSIIGKKVWRDAWLLQVLADPHATDGVKFVIAYHDLPDDQGMKIEVEKFHYNIKIPRRQIPLLDLEDDK